MSFVSFMSINQFFHLFILQIAKELVKNGIGKEHIGIITPYNSQANIIRQAACMTSLEIHTIDKYQVRHEPASKYYVGLRVTKIKSFNRIVFNISLTFRHDFGFLLFMSFKFFVLVTQIRIPIFHNKLVICLCFPG